MRDAELFAWLRRCAPSAGEITIIPEFDRTIIRLGGASEEDRARVAEAVAEWFQHVPASHWQVDA